MPLFGSWSKRLPVAQFGGFAEMMASALMGGRMGVNACGAGAGGTSRNATDQQNIDKRHFYTPISPLFGPGRKGFAAARRPVGGFAGTRWALRPNAAHSAVICLRGEIPGTPRNDAERKNRVTHH